jgi:hypothetical protein
MDIESSFKGFLKRTYPTLYGRYNNNILTRDETVEVYTLKNAFCEGMSSGALEVARYGN